MKNMIKIIIILIISTAFFSSFKIKAQGFEGKIIYKTNLEKPENSTMTDEHFKLIYNETDTNSKAIYYIRDGWIKMEFLEGESDIPIQVILYNPVLDKIYSYTGGQNEFCIWVDTKSNNQLIPEETQNINDTIKILDKKCSSINFEYGPLVKNRIYYPVELNIKFKTIEKSTPGFIGFIPENNIIPYKIIMYSSNFNMIYIVNEIKEEDLDDKLFEIPNFKQLVKSPFNLK